MDILLAAPTGRAEKGMTEATGYEAKTIHRLLELTGMPEEDEKSRTTSMHFERNRTIRWKLMSSLSMKCRWWISI